jgi:tetratricopeptide (TPR) repeat protein
MHYRLKSLSLTTATLLLSVTSPLLPLTLKFEPLIVQARTTQDRKAEATRLHQEGLQLLNRGQFQEALEKFQEALVIVREIGDKAGEGRTLNNIGDVYHDLEQYPKALEFYQQALAFHPPLRHSCQLRHGSARRFIYFIWEWRSRQLPRCRNLASHQHRFSRTFRL